MDPPQGGSDSNILAEIYQLTGANLNWLENGGLRYGTFIIPH